MLNPKELKMVINTLSTRKAWLQKTLETAKIDKSVKDEHINSLKLLDSSIHKLSNNKPHKQTSSLETPLGSNTKSLSIETARILIAEDNKDSARLYIDILEDMGFRNVEWAADGIVAFDKIKSAQKPYHIILCDWDMPGLTGLEVYIKAKASNTLKGAHFMMVTAVSEAARIHKAITKGVNDYIVKPVDVDVLEIKLKAIIENAAKN